MDLFKRLTASREAFESRLKTKDAERCSWNQKLALSLGNHLIILEQHEKSIDAPKVPASILQPLLHDFYSKHNASKISSIDEIIGHFQGREDALCAAMTVEYGECIVIPQSLRHTPKSKGIKSVVTRATEEALLPTRVYPLLLGSSSSNVAGCQEVWIELLEGSLRSDMCVRPGQVPEISIRTLDKKPVRVKLRVVGLKVVDGIKTGQTLGKALPIPAQLELDAQVKFNIIFVFKRGKWVAGQSYSFDIVKMKTDASSITDQLIKTVGNVLLPTLIRRALQKFLAPQLGKFLAKQQVENKESDVGLAVMTEFKVEGWPKDVDFHTNLRTTKAAGLLEKLNLKPMQIEALQLLNAEYARVGNAGNKGCFPLTSICLDQLLSLYHGVFLGDFVEFTNEAQDESSCGTEETECSSVDEASATAEEDNEHPPVFTAQPPEYQQMIALAAQAQAHIQADLDRICSVNNIPHWDLFRTVHALHTLVYKKSIAVELHINALDVRLDLDGCLESFQDFVFRKNKKAAQHKLKVMHESFAKLKMFLGALKMVTRNLQFSCTGALTGGECPAFEFSVREVSSEGLLDLQLDMLRVGGNMKELVSWAKEFLLQLRSRHLMTKLDRQQSQHAIKTMKEQLMDHVELIQFFIDGRLKVAGDDSLIFSVSAQRENPRPALSIHVAEFMSRLLPKHLMSFDPTPDYVDSLLPEWPANEHELTSQQAAQLLSTSAVAQIILNDHSNLKVTKSMYHGLLACVSRFGLPVQDLHYLGDVEFNIVNGKECF